MYNICSAQKTDHVQGHIRGNSYRTQSEDCVFMNDFSIRLIVHAYMHFLDCYSPNEHDLCQLWNQFDNFMAPKTQRRNSV